MRRVRSIAGILTGAGLLSFAAAALAAPVVNGANKAALPREVIMMVVILILDLLLMKYGRGGRNRRK